VRSEKGIFALCETFIPWLFYRKTYAKRYVTMSKTILLW